MIEELGPMEEHSSKRHTLSGDAGHGHVRYPQQGKEQPSETFVTLSPLLSGNTGVRRNRYCRRSIGPLHRAVNEGDLNGLGDISNISRVARQLGSSRPAGLMERLCYRFIFDILYTVVL